MAGAQPLAIAGVDVGGTKVSATVLSRSNGQIASVRVSTDASGPEGAYHSTKRAIERLAAENSIVAFDAIGVGIAGVVDPIHGTVTHAVNLGIHDQPLAMKSRLEDELATAVHVENDVNAAALGSHVRLSEHEDLHDLAYLSIGTGIAAGLVLNGRIHRGRHGAAGEIGHFPVSYDGPECECGLRGCLESVASGRVIERAWPVNSGQSPAAELFAAAERDDLKAVSLVNQFSDHVARGVHLLALAYDVDCIVIGGGVAQVGRPLLDAIDSALCRLGEGSAFVRALDLRSRVRQTPGGPIGAIGAATVAAEQLAKASLSPM